jgi:hypothetical protein
MKRLLFVLVAAATTALLITGAVTAVAGDRGNDGNTPGAKTIHLREVSTSFVTVANPPDGPAGDYLTFTSDLYSDGKKVGTDQGFCMVVSAAGDHQCSFSLFLPDGQISASGAGLLADTNVFDTPIVGGTDGYFGVRGVVHGVQETQEVAQITVSLAE